MDDLWTMVRRLRSERPSRNRRFEELSQPLARRARKVARRLDSLERELRSGSARVSIRHEAHGAIVTLDYPDVRVRRAAFLTREELALLADDPALAPLLESE